MADAISINVTQLQRLAIVPTQITDSIWVHLTPEQQHYLSRVLRHRDGDRFIAMDGQGNWWLAELQEQLTLARLLEPMAVNHELPLPLVLLVAMPKGSGMDDVVRQATELGVTTIVPVLSDRTLLQPSSQKLERWQRIVQEAAEQAERQIVPKIQAPQTWAEALQTWNASQFRCYLCTARGNRPHLLNCLLNSKSQDTPAGLVIATGPEGGWTEAEVNAAIAAGYQAVSLGDRVMRAVTAPLAALALIAASLETVAANP